MARRRGRKAKANKPKAAARKTRRAAPKRRASKAKTYGRGKYRALRARVGGRTVPTYVYLTKKKRVRKIPDFALAGYRSKGDLKKRTKSSKGKAASWKRFDRLYTRRKKAAERVSKRILAGKYAFTPNRRPRRRPMRTVTFQQWEKSMYANAKRKKKGKARRKKARKTKASRAQLRALKKARKALRKVRSAACKTRRKRKSTRSMGPYRANKRRKKARKSRRRARKNPLMQAAANKRRKKARRRKSKRVRRNPLMQAAANKRRRKSRRRARRNPLMQAAANRRRRKSRRYASNRRGGIRRYRRNMAQFVSGLMDTLKVGGVVAVGLIGQKVLTRFVAGYLPAGIASWKNTVAGLLVAAVGVPLASKFAGGMAKNIGAGMGAGLAHTILLDVLNNVGQGKVAGQLADYADGRGSPFYSGMGSYYEFQPGQTYSGMGEYYTTPGMAGMGSYGDSFGAAPQLTQAAAGVGEYILTSGQGIGEYEEVTPEYSPRTSTRDGIRPDLSSAENAISVAEAAAGVGAYGFGANQDVSMQNTVYPQGQGEDVPDQPGGSRAGVFCGSNGVFGPCA